ncbi:hypothetical protein BJ165DRAFT_1534746 [Panaeolus papilionaceus]|nr:hypothetical protein BJ165DRAFT_1534746 [Panaeolus papilionaceus]
MKPIEDFNAYTLRIITRDNQESRPPNLDIQPDNPIRQPRAAIVKHLERLDPNLTVPLSPSVAPSRSFSTSLSRTTYHEVFNQLAMTLLSINTDQQSQHHCMQTALRCSQWLAKVHTTLLSLVYSSSDLETDVRFEFTVEPSPHRDECDNGDDEWETWTVKSPCKDERDARKMEE